jgi:hypothetical protein
MKVLFAQDAKLNVGDKVEAGRGEDHDTGVIGQIQGEKAFVRWDSGVSTWNPVADLRKR